MNDRRTRLHRSKLLLAGLASLVAGLVLARPASADKAADLEAVAQDAFVYGYPLVLMDATKRAMTAAKEPGPHGAPVNRFLHLGTPGPSERWVVRPNLDTLYSSAWLDLSKEPIVLHVPKISDRFYLLQMMDAWTNVFASPGTRTAKAAETDYAIVGPKWHGKLPAGLERLESPTDMAWIIGRTQVNGPDDEPKARAIQEAYTLLPLSAWTRHEKPPASGQFELAPTEGAAPPQLVAAMDGPIYFLRLAELLAEVPPPARDGRALERFAAIGLVAGKPFHPSAEAERVFDDAARAALKSIAAYIDEKPPAKNGWRTLGADVGAYGTDYMQRAAVAMKGLGANLPQDAVYPIATVDADGRPLSGAQAYVIHFEPGRMPPVGAFWSVTLYDADGYLVANPIHRYALRDRDPLRKNPDGSLDLYVQRESPGKERAANWLPAPNGAFNLLLRLYLPKPAILDGTWVPPPVRRQNTAAH